MTQPTTGKVRQKRYQVGRRIGHGEMGVVYEAWDSKRERSVALKVYHRDDELTLARVRRIIERLRELRHVNVVELIELIEAGESPILVMERVDGEDMLSYCAGRWRSEPPGDGTVQVRCDVARLRSCLVQIASGLIALHQRGVIHRDLKPANLLVTPEGRLVILDFSLSDDRGRASDAPGGTIAYMAPEQAITDGTVGPAADWYALGVIAYQALAGKLPFDGPPQRVLQDKAMREPPRVDELVTGAPPDLVALCRALLVPDPDRRPRDADLVHLLGLAGTESQPSTTPTRPARQARAIDRAIDQLRAARAGGRAAVLAMVGEPGLGRSEVLGEIGRAVRASWPDAVVLELAAHGGALDRLGAELAAAWAKLEPAEQAAIVPRTADALLELLPALARVPALSAVASSPSGRIEHLRSTDAIDALRETLTLLSRRRPVVVLIDDLDELDGDARTVFADVLRAPDPPPILMAGTCADESKLPPIERLSPVPLDWWSRKEIESLLKPHGLPEAMQKAAAERSGGNPTLALEVARAWTLGETPADGDLAAIFAARIARLSPTAREVLIATDLLDASQPIATLGTALDLDAATLENAIDELSQAGLVATRFDARGPYALPLRRAVRTAVRAVGGPDLRRLALTLAVGREDLPAERRAYLWREAGDSTQAASSAADAAVEARARLRFHAASELFSIAVAGGRRDLELALAECAAASGNGASAARAFARAAAHASGGARLALEIRAAEHHTLAGEVDQGIAAFRAALGEIGISLAHTPGRAIPRLLLRRAWLRVRGIRFDRRTSADIAPQSLVSADACFSAAQHLGVLEAVIGMELQARATAMALDLGDPERLGRAAVMEAIFLSTIGAERRAARMIAMAQPLAAGAKAHAIASFPLMGLAAIEYFHLGRFDRALVLCDEFIRRARTDAEPPVWTLNLAQTYSSMALAYLGDVRELERRLHRQIREAERRGDRYAATIYRVRCNVLWLARGDVAGADEAIATAERQWPFGGARFRVPDYYRMGAHIERALWGGDPAAAARALARDFDQLERSMLTRVHLVRADADSLGARVAIATARRGRARAGAGRWLQRLRRNPTVLAQAYRALLTGCAALRDGAAADAIEPLRDSIVRADALSLGLIASAARIRLGEAMGGSYPDGTARGVHDLAQLGVTEVARIVAMTAPV